MSDFRVEESTGTEELTGHDHSCKSVIRVLGIGGGGGNSLQHMINESLTGVEFIAVNTDSQALKLKLLGVMILKDLSYILTCMDSFACIN